jgi:hypothetical protein
MLEQKYINKKDINTTFKKLAGNKWKYSQLS